MLLLSPLEVIKRLNNKQNTVESATDRHRGFFQLSERGAVPATLPLSYLLFLYVVVKCLKSLDVSEQIVHSNLSDL